MLLINRQSAQPVNDIRLSSGAVDITEARGQQSQCLPPDCGPLPGGLFGLEPGASAPRPLRGVDRSTKRPCTAKMTMGHAEYRHISD